jgi:hypothetical protein
MRTTEASAPAGSPENARWRRRGRRPTSPESGRAAGRKAEPPAAGKRVNFAIGESKRPGDLRGDIIADGTRQNAAHRAERCPGRASLSSGAYPSREFAIQQLFTLNIDQLRCRFPSLCHAKTLRVAETQRTTETYHIYLGDFSLWGTSGVEEIEEGRCSPPWCHPICSRSRSHGTTASTTCGIAPVKRWSTPGSVTSSGRPPAAAAASRAS